MSEPGGRSDWYDVAVVGCGMGARLAGIFARDGYSVVVWNRTPERAEALAGNGMKATRSVVDTVRSAELVVACTTSYDTTYAALDPVDDWHGTTFGASRRARLKKLREWSAGRWSVVPSISAGDRLVRCTRYS